MYRILFAMLACQAAVALAGFALPVVAPAAAVDFALSPTLVGYYTTLMLVGAMVSTLITAGFVRRYGAMRVSQATLIFGAAGMLALPFAARVASGTPVPLVLLLVVSAVLVGFAYGPANPASSHLLVRVTPGHLRARIFSIKQTSIPIGGATCGFALPLIERIAGWQGAVVAVAVVCLALAVVLQPLRADMDADRKSDVPLFSGGIGRTFGLVLRNPALRLLALAAGAFAAMQFCFVSLFVTYAVERTGLTLIAIGGALSAGLTASIFARMVWGWTADRTSPRIVLAGLGIAMALSAFGVAAIGPGWPYIAIVALAVVYGSTATAWQGVFLAEVARLSPAGSVADVTAGGMAVTFLGALVGPAISSALTGLTGYGAAGFIFVGTITLGFGLAFLVARRPG